MSSFLQVFLIIILILATTVRAEALDEEPAEAVDELQTEIASEDEITAGDFFRANAITNVRLSPDGSKVAYTEYQKVTVGNPASGFDLMMEYNKIYDIHSLSWSGNNVLIVKSTDTRSGGLVFQAMEVSHDKDGYKMGRQRAFRRYGYILDPLTAEPEQIMFAAHRFEKEAIYADIYRVSLFDDMVEQTNRRKRLNKGLDKAQYFVLDKNYEPVLGLGYDKGVPALYTRTEKNNEWKLIWSGTKDTNFLPEALSPDGDTLWALSNTTTDRMAAVEFDMSEARISQTLFEHDSHDLTSIEFSDGDTGPIGVTYLEGGQLRYQFFKTGDKQKLLELERLLPDQRVHVLGADHERSILLIGTTSVQDPVAYYLCDLDKDDCNNLGSVRPWLEKVGLAETQSLTTRSADGFEVSAYLTLPGERGSGVPLIVMPHGGPIGVQDTAYYSGHVQWLAKNGYAVLQVNYRGSSGYGKRFKDAGLRQWGRGIEDDIEASLENALSTFPILDRNRIGIYGISYGGYSALQSIIRNPAKYRCAASFAGVTDLTLLFNRPDVRRNKELRKILVEIVGDPEIDKQELIQYSPVYNYKDITKPVFIAHGNLDEIVDIEHSFRLKKVLELAGVEPDFHVLQRVGHGFEKVSQAEALYGPLTEFLDRHLK